MAKKGKGSSAPKGSAAKVGRSKRKPGRLEDRFLRAYANKLRRVNRDRAKSGKPPLKTLAGYNSLTGKPDSSAQRASLAVARVMKSA